MRMRCPTAGCFGKTDGRSVFLVSLVALLLVAGSADAQTALADDEATLQFCRGGRALTSAEAQRGAALVAERQVLPNPSLALSHERVFGDNDAAGEHETVVGIAVPLGIGGRRFLLQDAAAAWASQLTLAAKADRFAEAVAFRRSYVAAAVAHARLAVEREQQKHFAELIAKLTALADAGENAQHDRLQLHTAGELHAASVELLASTVAARRAWLEAMIGAKVALDTPVDKLVVGAGRATTHPHLASLRAEADAHARDVQAEERRWVPDVDLFAGYRTTTGGSAAAAHGFALELSFPLTFFDHGQGQVQRAEAAGTVALARAQRLERALEAARRAAATRLETLGKSAARVDRALSDAEKILRDAERMYLADEGTLLAVLEALRGIRGLALARIDLAAAMAEARLDHMSAAGRFGDRRLDSECGSAP